MNVRSLTMNSLRVRRFTFTPMAIVVGAWSFGCVAPFNDDGESDIVVQTGAHALVVERQAPDDACPAAGRLLESGPDLNGDGALSDDEITASSVVCDGAPALAGETLSTLPCVFGEIPVRVDDAWACVLLPAFTGADFMVSDQGCAPGLVAIGVDVTGAIVCDVAPDTLSALACAVGDVVKWTGVAYACAADNTVSAGSDTLSSLTCTSGQVAKWSGTSWACADDVDTDTNTDTDTLVTLACIAGQVAKWNGTSWACANDVDTNTNTDVLAGLSCASGQVAKWNGTSWACAADVDTNTDALAGLSCASGQVAKWNGTSWACAADTNTDVLAGLSCASGQVAKWNGTSWACAADVDTNTDVLAGLSCAVGEIAKWNGASWACAFDDAGGAASVFTTTVLVGANGTALDNGTALRTALTNIVAPSATNLFIVKIEPGIYDVGTSALPMRAFVDVEGSGPRSTIVRGAVSGDGVITGRTNSEIRQLGVDNTSSGATIIGIRGVGEMSHVKNVRINNTGASTVESVGIDVSGAVSTTNAVEFANVSIERGTISPFTNCVGVTIDVTSASTFRLNEIETRLLNCDAVHFNVTGPPSVLVHRSRFSSTGNAGVTNFGATVDMHSGGIPAGSLAIRDTVFDLVQTAPGGAPSVTGISMVRAASFLLARSEVNITRDDVSGGADVGFFTGVTSTANATPRIEHSQIRIRAGGEMVGFSGPNGVVRHSSIVLTTTADATSAVGYNAAATGGTTSRIQNTVIVADGALTGTTGIAAGHPVTADNVSVDGFTDFASTASPLVSFSGGKLAGAADGPTTSYRCIHSTKDDYVTAFTADCQ